jgi:hypothetical protein
MDLAKQSFKMANDFVFSMLLKKIFQSNIFINQKLQLAIEGYSILYYRFNQLRK